MTPTDRNGLMEAWWLPNFTIARLLVITALLAGGLALCPFLPTFVDGSLLMVAVIGLVIGVLYRGYAGFVLGGLIVWITASVALTFWF